MGRKRKTEIWQPPSRFVIQEFTNAKTGSVSWRVSGTKRDGTRVRQNFQDKDGAVQRQSELQQEYMAGQSSHAMRITNLSEPQLRIAETAFALVEADEDVLTAVHLWLRNGAAKAVKSPRLDDAVEQFHQWLDETPSLRPRTKDNLRTRSRVFANGSSNRRVADITADHVDDWLSKLRVSPASRDNYKRAVSRFFSWSMDRPRRWTAANPCHAVKVEQGEKAPPAVLTVVSCEKLMREAQKLRDGKLVPYCVVCLFAGLRPFEAQRLTWEQVNLLDGEIHLDAHQTKTKQPRTIHIDDHLRTWLESCKGKPFYPTNWRKDFSRLQKALGYRTRDKDTHGWPEWPVDVMRHTAISHHFRKHQSYGMAAERFGNSEAIIKRHYQGRVTSAETEAFYSIEP